MCNGTSHSTYSTVSVALPADASEAEALYTLFLCPHFCLFSHVFSIIAAHWFQVFHAGLQNDQSWSDIISCHLLAVSSDVMSVHMPCNITELTFCQTPCMHLVASQATACFHWSGRGGSR